MTLSDSPHPAVLQLEPDYVVEKSTNAHQNESHSDENDYEHNSLENDHTSSSSSSSSCLSFSDAISIDSAIHCNSVSSEQSSISGDKPTCRICLCTNDEIDDDGNSVVSVKVSNKCFKNSKKNIKQNNNAIKKNDFESGGSRSPFTRFDPNDPHILVTPCYCSGTLEYVHHKCLQQWIRTSSRQYCDMCRYHFKLHIKNKPFYTWECIKMTARQKRRFVFHSLANLFAFLFVFWSTHVILDRAIHDLTSHRRMNLRVWVKMLVIMFTLLSGFAFIYFQLKSFFESVMRLKRYNQIVIIENITKDTLQKVQSFKSLPVNDANQSNKELDKADITLDFLSTSPSSSKLASSPSSISPPSSSSSSSSSSSTSPSPSPSNQSRKYQSDIVISIDGIAQRDTIKHS